MLSLLLVGHVVISLFFYANSCEGGCSSQVWSPIVLGAVAYCLFVLVPVKYVPCLARFHVQEATACENFQCCTEKAEEQMPHEAAEDEAEDTRYSHLRYSALLASHVRAARHVTYDVPVPELGDGALKINNQPRFLRYDFTPEILRIPYYFPRNNTTSSLPGGVSGRAGIAVAAVEAAGEVAQAKVTLERHDSI